MKWEILLITTDNQLLWMEEIEAKNIREATEIALQMWPEGEYKDASHLQVSLA